MRNKINSVSEKRAPSIEKKANNRRENAERKSYFFLIFTMYNVIQRLLSKVKIQSYLHF